MTFAYCLRVKFVHLKVEAINSLYICKISLWLTTPGLVKFHMPVQFLFAISIEIGSNSSRTVILFGIFTTFSYREIFVMKLRGLFIYEEMGTLTLEVQTFSKFRRRSSTWIQKKKIFHDLCSILLQNLNLNTKSTHVNKISKLTQICSK